MIDLDVSLVARLAAALVPLAAVILAASGAAPVGGLTGEEGQMLTDDVAIQVTSERGSATSGQPADGRPLDAAIAGTPAPRFVTVATGVRLEYVEQGRADGLPVIFLHGVTDSWRSFELLLQRLPASIRAFAISQRGHGDSSRPDIGYRYRDFSEDVRAFMDAIGLERAVVVGHSMGAMVSQRLIVDHPQRVSRVVLMGAFATIHGNPVVDEFVTSAIVPLVDPIAPDFAREWQLSTLASPIDPRFLDTVVGETLKVPARVWHQTFAGFLATPDFTHELAGVTVPVLLLWGDRDTYAVRADQDALLKAMPTSRLVAYEGTGHAIHWEEPARVAATLLGFVDESR
ncbi:MAG TPA: alpha/beta hydrolase [Vicinamibacterales bacterium]|nr:alpha/beta hydrolase [Vicinamibacterales bacterium]